MTASAEILFALLRAALGKGAASCEGAEARSEGLDLGSVSGEVWKEVIDLSFDQGVAAMLVDGIDKATKTKTKTKTAEALEALDSPELEDLKYEWFGSVFQAEEDYKKYVDDIASLAKAYSEAGIEMMVLKGYGLSLNYPEPAHRPVGDVDIYLNDNDNDDDNDDDGQLPAWRRGEGASPTITIRFATITITGRVESVWFMADGGESL